MGDSSGFRVRLRVRVAKGFTTDATSLQFIMANKEVTITSQNKDESLNKAKWLVLSTRGFSTDQAARHFGSRLRSTVQLAALSSRIGADVGQDKATTWMDESFARSIGLIQEHERIAPNVHGLAILPDDDNIRFPTMNAEGTVTADPEQFLAALKEAGENEDIAPAVNAVRLLNLALMTSEPLAQMVLSFSGIEELGQDQKWSEVQVALIKQLAEAAEASTEGTEADRAEVARAIRQGLFPLSLRQGVMRLMSRLGLDDLRKEWDRLYSIRSGIFHGTARSSEADIGQAAGDTITLCGRIILSILANNGIRVPAIAETHFKISTAD
jgi:hypothetical protein